MEAWGRSLLGNLCNVFRKKIAILTVFGYIFHIFRAIGKSEITKIWKSLQEFILLSPISPAQLLIKSKMICLHAHRCSQK